MSFFATQNPGIGGLDELTLTEEAAVQAIAALGTPGQFLRTNLAGTGVEWAAGGAGGGDVTKVGIPVNNQVGVWTGDGTIEGDTALTFDTVTDTLTTGILNSTSLTASQIVITDASKNLVSAAVATYPSLAELIFLKGVTSAIQTQLNAKQATITFGTGVLTALGVAVGSAGAPVLFNGALGTPTSGTLTNATGLPVSGIAASTVTAIGVGSVELGHASDTSITRVSAGVIAVEGVTVPTISSTNTLTNKRITKRTGTTTSSATPTINTDNVDEYYITAQAVDITSFTTGLTGTPTLGQMLFISVIGTAARAITWGASFGNGPVALPTTTVTTTELSTLLKWNGSVWRCYATGSRV